MASVYFTTVVFIICYDFLMFKCDGEDKCYVKASCTKEENFLKMSDQSTAKKCEKSCSKDDECKWWSFRPNVKKCRLYKGKNCGLDYKKKNQISGQRGCDAKQKPVGSPGNPPIPAGNRDDNVCFVKAACTKDDNLLESNDQSSALECFKSCLDDNEDCQWWTFRPNLNQCDLYSGDDCGLDFSKEVPVSGQRNCDDPSRPTVSPCQKCPIPPPIPGGWPGAGQVHPPIPVGYPGQAPPPIPVGWPGYGQVPPPIPAGNPGYGPVPPPVPAYG